MSLIETDGGIQTRRALFVGLIGTIISILLSREHAGAFFGSCVQRAFESVACVVPNRRCVRFREKELQ
jgi:hypothetical protein